MRLSFLSSVLQELYVERINLHPLNGNADIIEIESEDVPEDQRQTKTCQNNRNGQTEYLRPQR